MNMATKHRVLQDNLQASNIFVSNKSGALANQYLAGVSLALCFVLGAVRTVPLAYQEKSMCDGAASQREDLMPYYLFQWKYKDPAIKSRDASGPLSGIA